MEINERVRLIRTHLKLTQGEFGKKIVVAQNYLSNIENGYRDVTEKIIKIICSEFNVNEEWLRYGKGEMFVQTDTFSLDEYAKKNNLTALEIAIMKGYMELDEDIRKTLLKHVENLFKGNSETTASTHDLEDDIDTELEKYRLELEAEKKKRMLSASRKRETS